MPSRCVSSCRCRLWLRDLRGALNADIVGLFKDEPLSRVNVRTHMYSYNPNRKGLTEVRFSASKVGASIRALQELNRDFLLNHAGQSLRVDRETPIASIGSCFAREIKLWLIENGYTYLQTADGPCTESGSARYDRVFNTYSIRQEFERAFGTFEPETKCWEVEEDGRTHLLSPYRYCLAWDSKDEMDSELAEHKQAVQKAFTDAKVVIITVGQPEIWYDKRDGSVFPMVPPTEIFDPEIHAFRMSTYQENLENLNRCYELLKQNNPMPIFSSLSHRATQSDLQTCQQCHR